MKNRVRWILIFVSLLWITGCLSSNANTIANAQACLDSATQATASTCSAMVDGMNSTDAYVIRCSADFIAQGFTASAMANAFTQLKNTSGNPGVLDMLGFLVFSSQQNADTAMSDCKQSGVESFGLLSALSDTATLAAFAAGYSGGIPDRSTAYSNIASGISTLDSTSTGQAEVGNAVLVAYDTTCANPANSSSQMCTSVVQAVQQGGSDPTTVGHLFMSSL